MAKRPQANKKNFKKSPPKTQSAKGFWGLPLTPWVVAAQDEPKPAEGADARLIVVGSRAQLAKHLGTLADEVPEWQLQRLVKQIDRCDESLLLAGENGPIWIVAPHERSKKDGQHYGLMTQSAYARTRDLVGALVMPWEVAMSIAEVSVEFKDCTDEQVQGAVVGLELGSYSFKMLRKPPPRRNLPTLTFVGVKAEVVATAAHLGLAANIARHLTNLPPAELHPESYAMSVADLFAKVDDVAVEIWDPKKIQSERMGLLHGVGKGASNGPHLVTMRYRPKGKKAATWALVGKGVTFDTGGLDIKPPAGMRLMKKDMGGSATLVGLLWALTQNAIPVACDIYLSLAENAVDAAAFHPSDVLVSRSGLTVEIHNTDAEGRLVMADAFTLALENSDASTLRGLIDVSTLTGAIKVGLGADVPGLFATDDSLADALLAAAQSRGERMWRMPLVEEYARELNSTVADMSNASNSGFGGAITAALFLKRFTQGKPWAHLDIYAWTDYPLGGYREAGATGQGVQALTQFIKESTKS